MISEPGKFISQNKTLLANIYILKKLPLIWLKKLVNGGFGGFPPSGRFKKIF